MKTKEKIIKEELDRILIWTQGKYYQEDLTNVQIRKKAIKKILPLFSQQKQNIMEKGDSKKSELTAQKELLLEILLDYEKSRLEGKGYDFYFVLNEKVDHLKQKLTK